MAETELSRTLRRLRSDAGMSQPAAVKAARLRNLDQSRLSRLETGRYVPEDAEIRALARAYQIPDAGRDEMLSLAAVMRPAEVPARAMILSGTGWAIQRRILGVERTCAEVCDWQPALVAGLLQTEAYMRLVFSEGGDFTSDDVERSVTERLRRQELLDSPRSFVFLMPEGTLRWQAGSPQVMLGQLARIAEVIEGRPNVHVGIIPTWRPVEVFTMHGFSLYDRRQVILGLRNGTSFLPHPHVVADYSKLFGELEALAVYGNQAREVIERVAAEYRALSD